MEQTETYKNAEKVLKDWLSDASEIKSYLDMLPRCQRAYDVAERIIRPLYADNKISPDVAKSQSFYMSFVDAFDNDKERNNFRSLLYHHIVRVIDEVDRSARAKALGNHLESKNKGLNTEAFVNQRADGSMDGYVRFSFSTNDKRLTALIIPLFRYLLAKLTPVDDRGFGAENFNEGLLCYEVECPQDVATVLLSEIEDSTTDRDIRLEYSSTFVRKTGLTIDDMRDILDKKAK